MWKVTFEDRRGQPVGIYWVDGATAIDAEATARRQAGHRIITQTPALVAHAGELSTADEVWPRPRLLNRVRVFAFDDSREAYDQTQVRNDIHDGDILHIPGENVAGLLMQAWPVAVSPNTGALHALADSSDLVVDDVDYTTSARLARSLVAATAPSAPTLPPPATYGLRYGADTWTVTIAGSERHVGGTPCVYVVDAPNATLAAAKAAHHHRTSEDDDDTIVRYLDPGAPTAGYPYTYQDLRGIPSQTVVLTPDDIRHIARIRLACKRLERYTARAEATSGRSVGERDADRIGDMTARIALLVGQFIHDLGHTT
jgi:hypothetical protein